MGAVRLVFGARLRRRWRSWLILVVLAAHLDCGVGSWATAASRTPNRDPCSPALFTFFTDMTSISTIRNPFLD